MVSTLQHGIRRSGNKTVFVCFRYALRSSIHCWTRSKLCRLSPHITKHLAEGLRAEDGAPLVELALLLPMLLLLLVGAVDYGRGYYAAIEVSSAAESGALYGTLNPSDKAGMVAMAKLDAADVSGLTATAVYGCECSDGSTSSASCAASIVCSSNVVKYVQVTTSATYTPILPYPGIPSNLNLTRTVRLRAGQ